MRILHLSDIHIPSENDRDFEPFILKPFLSDIAIHSVINSCRNK